MDKPIAKERLKDLAPIPLNLSKHTDPNGEVYYRGNVQNRGTVDVDGLAARVAAKRSELRPETLAYAFANLKEEIYAALARGETVDVGIGTLSLRVKGRFDAAFEEFDPDRHAFNIVFSPSPRARQLEEHLRGHKNTGQATQLPVITEVSATRTPDKENFPFNTIPVGSPYIYIFGRNIRLMGDHPDVSIRFYAADESQEIVVPMGQLIFLNERGVVGIHLQQPLAAGEWTVEIHTQFRSSYHLSKLPRVAQHTFTVIDPNT